jgi:hypothetical protein
METEGPAFVAAGRPGFDLHGVAEVSKGAGDVVGREGGVPVDVGAPNEGTVVKGDASRARVCLRPVSARLKQRDGGWVESDSPHLARLGVFQAPVGANFPD